MKALQKLSKTLTLAMFNKFGFKSIILPFGNSGWFLLALLGFTLALSRARSVQVLVEVPPPADRTSDVLQLLSNFEQRAQAQITGCMLK